MYRSAPVLQKGFDFIRKFEHSDMLDITGVRRGVAATMTGIQYNDSSLQIFFRRHCDRTINQSCHDESNKKDYYSPCHNSTIPF
jgi:hypothetical protein